MMGQADKTCDSEPKPYSALYTRLCMTPQELRSLRLALGWSQSRLAQELGCSRYTISKWERGVLRPIPKLVEKYLALLTE